VKITQNGNEKLDDYYVRKPDPVPPCLASNKIKCCKFSPYDIKETFNYILKMLVLPGLIAGAIIFILLFQYYDNIVIQTTSFVITYIATILIFIANRERIMGAIHHITVGEELTQESLKLNDTKDPTLSIGFVGDIMMMRDYKLIFDPLVKSFFDGVNFIVGNLEGIITDQELSSISTKQAHSEVILDELNQLLNLNTKWLLCVSNNHSIDFGNTKFIDSINTIQKPNNQQNSQKFNAFGRNDVPRAFLKDDFCISTATNWSNQKAWKCASRFRDSELEGYHCNNRFNILYPHWGYENERYVRKSIQKSAKELLTRNLEQDPEARKKKWDLIFGHHPHVRQPIVVIEGEELKMPNGNPVKDSQGNNILLKKLVAFSGGNFTSGANFLRRKKHINGKIMRCEIGPLYNDPDHFAVGEVKWHNTVNEIVPDSQEKTKIVKIGEGETGILPIYMTIINVAVIVVVILLTIFREFL